MAPVCVAIESNLPPPFAYDRNAKDGAPGGGVTHGVEAADGKEREGGKKEQCEEVAGGEWREKKSKKEKKITQRR